MTQPAPLASRRALFALVALGFAAGAAGQPPSTPSLAPMIERVSPAVVNISISGSVAVSNPLSQDEFFRRFFDFEAPGGRREVEASGSGVIVDAAQGYILTNHHVIENADRIMVTLLDNRSFPARIVGSDKSSDVAVLQVTGDGLEDMPLGDSSKLRVGDYVVAIGNPFGFSHTVTSGIVSALGRSGINRDAYEDFIQTDASINPGNSGGALVNLNGELVGINSAILSRTGGNIGIGFAIPVNMVQSIMEQLISYGSVRRGLLGVNIGDIDPDTAATLGLHDNSGALVSSVNPNSAAERAGIRVEDVIVSINGTRIRDSGSLKAMIGLLRPGEQVRVGLIRDGREQTVLAELGELAATPAAPEPEPELTSDLDPAFDGAEIVPNDPAGTPGLLVARVEPDSPADLQGLRPGDVITRVNRVAVRTMADATQLVKGARSIILTVQRGNREQLILLR